MRRIALAGIVCVLILAGIVACRAWRSSNPDILQIGNFLALALTLVVLIWYAHDTNVMARVAQERWMREGVLGTTYSMQLLGGKADAGRTLFQLQNPSTLVVRVFGVIADRDGLPGVSVRDRQRL